jgi:hypothetical protein
VVEPHVVNTVYLTKCHTVSYFNSFHCTYSILQSVLSANRLSFFFYITFYPYQAHESTSNISPINIISSLHSYTYSPLGGVPSYIYSLISLLDCSLQILFQYSTLSVIVRCTVTGNKRYQLFKNVQAVHPCSCRGGRRGCRRSAAGCTPAGSGARAATQHPSTLHSSRV